MHLFDNLLYKIQSQTGSLCILLIRFDTIKFIEDMVHILGGNAHTCIIYGNRNLPFDLIQIGPHRDLTISRGIFDRITEQVDHHL